MWPEKWQKAGSKGVIMGSQGCQLHNTCSMMPAACQNTFRLKLWTCSILSFPLLSAWYCESGPGQGYNALLVGGGSQVRVNKSNNLDTLALEIGSMNRLILFIEVSSTNIVHHLSKCNFSLFSAHSFMFTCQLISNSKIRHILRTKHWVIAAKELALVLV